MRIGSNWKSVVLGLMAYAAMGGSAGAQQPAAQPAAPPSPDAQVGFERKAQLSPQEQVVQSDGILVRMESSSAAVRKQLGSAREQRDVVKVQCLNDKLSQIDVAIRSARERKVALKAAADRNDSELSNHEFTILTVLKDRTAQLTTEANQCLGEEAAFISEPKVTMTIEPNMPATSNTDFPEPEGTNFGAPPVPASGSK